jgi:aminoglycoside 3-N-acetyltransferase
MSLRDFLRSITPSFLLNWNRKRKKENRNAQLGEVKKSGKSIQQSDLENDFRKAGIEAGDVVLVHTSLSRIGHLKDGPKTFVDALRALLGDEGTILMPTSPNAVYQYDFIQDNKTFDVLNTPSKTGAITEYFRKIPGVVRSIHPTEPVAALGPQAHYFTSGHFGQLTPYNEKSPFRRVAEKNGKLLYVGVTLSMAGTSLHTLEDAVDFKFPVYHKELFEVDVIDENGVLHRVKTKVHNPVYSKKRRCDELIPMFVNAGAMKHVKIGEADSLIADAKAFFDVMVKNYTERGVTMYTPFGSSTS